MALEGKRINELTEVSKVDTSSKLAIDTGGEEALSITLKNLIDSSGVSSVDIATTEKAGIVKPDGTTIAVSSDGTISSSGSGFDFEGTRAEFDAAVTAGTITDDSVSLITDDVSGDTVATKADLAVVENGTAKADLSNIPTAYDYVVESVVNADGSWYRKYKSGWLEQGGYWKPTTNTAWETITLLKPFANTNYYLNLFESDLTSQGSADSQYFNCVKSYARTTIDFKARTGLVEKPSYAWEAKGMGAN